MLKLMNPHPVAGGLPDPPGRSHLPVFRVSNLATNQELKEATGLIAKPSELQVASIMYGTGGGGPPNGFLAIVFAVYMWVGELVNAERHKLRPVTWVHVDQVPSQHVATPGQGLMSYFHHGPMVSTADF